MFSILRPFLFNLDPETAHDLAIKSLKFNVLPSKLFEVEDEHMLNIKLLGKHFPNPIGLAAGFDKSAEVYNSILKLGFGFVEVGTVTPLKQFGNLKPRIFRLEDDSALINRLGFNKELTRKRKKNLLNKIRRENKTKIPLLLKVSPDISDGYVSEIAGIAIKNDISAVILTNTSEANRDDLVSEKKSEKGGLSGEPIKQISTNMIKKFYKQLNGTIPIIGVGGINSGKSAYEKISAGASLLQLYTGFVYKGPSVAKDIKRELIQILKTEGLSSIKDAVGKHG